MFRFAAIAFAGAAFASILLQGRPALAAGKVTIGGVEMSADCPLAKKEHPRLLFTKADLPRLRERLKDPRIAAELDHARKLAADKKAGAILLGVLYYLTDDKQYLDAAKAALGQPSWIQTWPLAADLVMGGLDAKEQDALADKLVAVAKAEQWRPHLVLDLAAWGHGQDKWIDEDLKKRYRHDMVQWIEDNNVWSSGRGGSSMSHGYYGEHFYSEPMTMAVAWSNATGIDWVSRCDFAAHAPEWYVFHYRPFTARPQVVHVGVTSVCDHWEAIMPAKFDGEDLAVLAASRFGDGLGQWWIDNVISKASVGWGDSALGQGGVWGKLLYCDPKLPSAAPESLPPARLFPENGHVVMRSDWSRDATYALFRCGRFGEIDGAWGRNNADNLHFIIDKKGVLAPDTGGVHSLNSAAMNFAGGGRMGEGVPHLTEYARQTIAHNSITVGPDGPTFRDYQQRSMGTPRRGGQSPIQEKSWWKAWGVPEPKGDSRGFKEGDIVAYETSPLFDYAAGDATHSYPPDRVKSISRQFVYVRPDTFIIFDRVVAAKEGLETVWMLHALYEPAWNGKTAPDESLGADKQFVIDADGKTLKPNPKPGGHFLHTAGDTFTIDDKYQGMSGRLFAKVLWPQEDARTLRTIGGPWHDFELDGVNYGPTEQTYAKLGQGSRQHDRVNTIGVSGWRIELSPKARPAATSFLTVLHATDQKTAAMPPAERIESPGRMGAKVRIDAKTYEVTFATDGKIAGRIKITDGDKTILDRNLAGGVEDNYRKWSADGRYESWMTRPEYRNFIGAKEADEYLRTATRPAKAAP
ncbi:MAG: heparinase II/III family protein [Phycisphaerae bacterium]